MPMALHGGTGLSAEQFRDLIARGCAKVNISTALKERYMQAGLEFLKRRRGRRASGTRPRCSPHQKAAVVDMAREHMQLFGSSGRAW